jgi:CRISPR-associated protein Csm3
MQLFGISGGDKLTPVEAKELGLGLTRLSFRDCNPDLAWVSDIQERNLLMTEVKFENSINRIAGTAESPRNFERVPAGAIFEFTVNVKILENDDQNALLDLLLTGLKLLEMDALGGSGSRGYGRLQFHLQSDLQQRLNAISPFGNAA